MKIILVFATLSNIAKALPQYNYPRPSQPVSYNRPNYGGNNFSPPASPINQFPYNNGNGGTDYQDPEVHKHIYVHVPPPELNNKPKEKQQIKPERPQKHYKIVFIKAPTPPSPTVNIPPPPQIEEKTLVYVLVKKPDEIEDIPYPAPAPTEPSKPEVYFIRYKSKKEEGEEETDNGYERKIEVVDNEGNEYEKPAYLPPLTQLFSPAYLNLEDSY